MYIMSAINKKFLLFLLFLTATYTSWGQYITSVGVRWDNSFKEWIVDTSDGEGELKTRWMFEEDWSDWSFDIGDLRGRIKMKWKDDPNEWEIRAGNEVISARTIFKNDFREWRIANGRQTIKIKTRFGNNADEWQSDPGHFYMNTVYQGDARDWYVEDELEGFSLSVRMALLFVVIYSSGVAR